MDFKIDENFIGLYCLYLTTEKTLLFYPEATFQSKI